MKTQRQSRMVIAYMPEKLHKEIRKFCIDREITLAKWAELAHKKISTV